MAKCEIIQHKAVITYSDCRNRMTELTKDELDWFYAWVERAKHVTGCTVDIVPYDHELYASKHQDALGCTITNKPDDVLGDGVDTYITVDCYFIDECWKREFQGAWTLETETLPGVLAHEIAHLTYWRHGKKHSELTARLLKQIQDAA